MTILLQNLIGGLAAGSIYGLAALGLTAVFKTTGVVNFAQGDMAMVSTFIAYTLLAVYGVPYGWSFLTALLFSALFGAALERVFVRPLQHKPAVSQIMVTLGMAMMLNGAAGLRWGYEPQVFPAPIGGLPYRLGGVAVSGDSLLVFLVAGALMMAMYLFFRFTLAGIALRAVANNPFAARLMGIPIGGVYGTSWAVAAVLGGVAGVLIAPATTLDPNFMAEVGIKGFAAAVLGGFHSLPGAVLGGLVLGVLENLIAGYLSTEVKAAFAFSLILAVLVLRPHGLLGVPAAKKV